MKPHGMGLVGLAALLAGGWLSASEPPLIPESPAKRMQATVDAVLANDVVALFSLEGDSQLESLARRWGEARERNQKTRESKTPATEDERQLSRAWNLLQTDAGVEVLLTEWQAELATVPGGSLSSVLSIAFAGAFGKELARPIYTPQERAALIGAMQAAQAWALRIDWHDPKRLRQAATIAAQAVRKTGARDFQALEDLAFEDVLLTMEHMLAAIKKIALVYEIDLDAILRTYRAEEVLRVGNEAELEIRCVLFGVPVKLRRTHDLSEWGSVQADRPS